MLSDIRQAVRLLLRNPSLTAVACVTLALGVGLNTAIFSVVDVALFRPLPYRDPEQLVDVAEVTGRGTPSERHAIGMTWGRVADWRGQRQLFADIATYGGARRMWLNGETAGPGSFVGRLSPGFMKFLGLTPRLGREFSAADFEPAQDHVVIVSSGYWRRALREDPSVLGTTLTISNQPYTIVGVAPETFRFLVGMQSEAWLPQVAHGDPSDPSSSFTGFIGRLRPGLSPAQATHELDLAAVRIQEQRPDRQKWEAELMPIGGRRGTDAVSPTLFMLLGAGGFVLLIVCANVANLLLSRTVTREREIAVRSALGATRARIVRQFFVEAMVLAATGGAIGVFFAWWSTAVIPRLVPATLQYALFGANPLQMDLRLLGFSSLFVFITGGLCGLVPALRASRPSITISLTGARIAGAATGQRWLRGVFQALQVGLTFVLLVGAGLLVNSFIRMVRTDAGFDSDRLGQIAVSISPGTYPTRPQQDAAFAGLIERVRGLPGIEAATYGNSPAEGGAGRLIIAAPGGDVFVRGTPLTLYVVDPDYFAVAGIPVRAGRRFGLEDDRGAPPVAMIDELTARRVWPDGNAIGQRFKYSPLVPAITIAGIVGRVRNQEFAASFIDAQVYVPLAQQENATYRTLLIRSAQPAAATGAASAIVSSVDPAIRVGISGMVSDAYEVTLGAPRFYLLLMALLAAVAVVTAAVGLYGLLAYSVSQRTREIGVRIALGADLARLRRLVVGEALGPVLAGIAIGLVGSFWLTRVIRTLLYQVTPHDPLTLVAIVLLLIGVAAIAAVIPVRRATRVDPVSALRME